jgi:hypothetical protein
MYTDLTKNGVIPSCAQQLAVSGDVSLISPRICALSPCCAVCLVWRGMLRGRFCHPRHPSQYTLRCTCSSCCPGIEDEPLSSIFSFVGLGVAEARIIRKSSFSSSLRCLGLCGCPVELGGQAVPPSHQEPGTGGGAGALADEGGPRSGAGHLPGPLGCSPHPVAGGRGRLAASLRTDWTYVPRGQVGGRLNFPFVCEGIPLTFAPLYVNICNPQGLYSLWFDYFGCCQDLAGGSWPPTLLPLGPWPAAVCSLVWVRWPTAA